MRAFLLSVFLVFGVGNTAFAQSDEIIVTGSRISESPGIMIEKKGDFLLLEVRIMNDSRERSARYKELNATIEKVIAAAKNDMDIELSLIDDNDFVRPLSKDSFQAGIQRGAQPDTSYATLKVKTDIPDKVEDSFKLASKLVDFVETIEAVGRTTINVYDEVSVSIINPYQYRDEVRTKVIQEMKATLAEFGPDYVIVPKGLEGPVKWTRSGDLNLSFYMDYSYKIYPKSLSIQISQQGEFDDED